MYFFWSPKVGWKLLLFLWMTKTRNVEKVILKLVGLEKRGKGEVEKGVYKSYVALKAGQVRSQELRSFRFRARQFLREIAERCQCFLRREGGKSLTRRRNSGGKGERSSHFVVFSASIDYSCCTCTKEQCGKTKIL